jgi:hypothetical protein
MPPLKVTFEKSETEITKYLTVYMEYQLVMKYYTGPWNWWAVLNMVKNLWVS